MSIDEEEKESEDNYSYDQEKEQKCIKRYRKRRNLYHIRLEDFFKDYYNIPIEINHNDILVSGLMRTAGKTYKILEFLFKKIDDFPKAGFKQILYVTRTIGTVLPENNKGTMYDTANTIRRIEQTVPHRRNNPQNICLIAGKEKICQIISDLGQSQKKFSELQQLLGCEECDKSKTIGSDLEKRLKEYTTLRPYDTKILAEEFDICPKVIQQFYADNVAGIILISYAMLSHWKYDKDKQIFIIYDEARHFTDRENIPIATFQKEKGKPTKEEMLNAFKEQSLPHFYANDPIEPEWYKKTYGFICIYEKLITQKIRALHRLNGFKRDIDDEFEQQELKEQFEYVGDVIVHHMKEYPPGCYEGVDTVHFADDYLITYDEEEIRKVLFDSIGIFLTENIPVEQRDDFEKTINILKILHELSGVHQVEIETLLKPGMQSKLNTYSITLKPFYYLPKYPSVMNFYIEGVPYPSEFYQWWLDIPQNKIDVINIPNDTNITIIYEDVKKNTGDIYGHGSQSEPFLRHLAMLKAIKEKLDQLGLKTCLVARTKEISAILGSNGLKTDFVSGDIEGEGTQLDADILLMEGVQIRNIHVDTSRQYEIAQYIKDKKPSEIIEKFKDINTMQTMIQTMCRTIDRQGKKRNIIILLGNQMPHKSDICWVEMALQYWSYLRTSKIHYVKIMGGEDTENKIKEIFEVITNINYDYTISPFKNQILRYINGRPNRRVKKQTLIDHFQNPNETIRRTKKVIYDTIKEMESDNFLKKEDGVLEIVPREEKKTR